ncbi:V-type ATPase subunit [Desulfuromonas sp. TF]|uniref:V-type ATPase subunit n=1 Tax=Desulfuromonas sp. TF TaxID=1232410 RepID=UPI0004036A6A|nr:V-type ATPase subunit [Desulfuromonas sp. TF]
MALRLLRYSYGAVRSRALAAGLLKPEQIGDLLDCASKTEAERWLEKKVDIPAGAVEAGLHGRFMAFGKKVSRSLPTPARELLFSYLSRGQVENLKVLCRNLLVDRRQETDRFLLPDAQGKIVTTHCAAAGTPEELLKRLPRSPYRDAVRAALAASPEERLFRVESGLDRTFWEMVWERSRRLAFFDRRAALEILGMRADIEWCRVLGRGIRAGLPAATILDSLPPLGALLPARRVRIALKSENPAAAVAQLMTGIDGDPLGTDGETFLFRRLYRHLRRTLISHPFDVSVPLSSLLLMELETHDLKSIFGGKRVGSAREDILPFLSSYGV